MSQAMVGVSETEHRSANDYYRTPGHATQSLMLRETFGSRVPNKKAKIWEPACGDGAISQILIDDGHDVRSTDLIYRNYQYQEVQTLDFLSIDPALNRVDHVITNPPFRQAQEFAEKALEVVSETPGGKVALILCLKFLAGQKRSLFLEKSPLKMVYVFSKRLDFGRGDVPGKGAGMLDYAWFVWETGYKGAPQVDWIH